MLAPLALGTAALLACLLIQVACVVMMLRYLLNLERAGRIKFGIGSDITVLLTVLMILAVGHLVQIAIWASLFVRLGEFADFSTSFYYSTVNFATLGYGDIVMSEPWRLLGALEAVSGVLMFGLSTSTLFAVMSQLVRKHRA